MQTHLTPGYNIAGVEHFHFKFIQGSSDAGKTRRLGEKLTTYKKKRRGRDQGAHVYAHKD
jgi:hypothetical protein